MTQMGIYVPGEPRARGEWIEACEFHDLTEAEVLREVARRVRQVERPLVLLDLDSTLYEVQSRTLQILREWVAAQDSRGHRTVREAVAALEVEQLGYTLADTFRAIGLDLSRDDVKVAWESAKKFWADRFFTSEYLRYDTVYPGASRFAREVHDLGAELVYLTGRDEPGMGDGTRARLRGDGFPFDAPRTHLLLKKDFVTDDLEHKQAAAEYIRRHGTLVASFENEPPNVVALYELFPEAMHVFVDTVCSDRSAPAARGLYRIRGFGIDQ
jgi:hypothetical protein